MSIEIDHIVRPPALSRRASRLLADASKLGLVPLGWLALPPLTVAAFRSENGAIALAIHDPMLDGPFDARTIDLVSQLGNGRRLTTTSFPVAPAQEHAGLFKFSHPGASLKQLLQHHEAHIKELGGKPKRQVMNLKDFMQALRDYLQAEMQTPLVAGLLGVVGKLRQKKEPPSETVHETPVQKLPRKKIKSPVDGEYVGAGDPSIHVILEAGGFQWGGPEIHNSGVFEVAGKDHYSVELEFRSNLGPEDSKRIEIYRKGSVYIFKELPKGSETNFKRLDGILLFADSAARKIAPIPRLGELAPSGEYLQVEATVEKHQKGGFCQNVKKEVIPLLIKKGIIRGKTAKSQKLVLCDRAFVESMRYGIEEFVANRQGWCFVAVRAPIAEVAERLKQREEVNDYVENVTPPKPNQVAEISGREEWDFFVVQCWNSAWTVIIQSVHGFDSSMAQLGERIAVDLAQRLKTLAILAWDDDFAGACAYLFESKRKSRLWTEEDRAEYFAFFYERKLHLPECFIGSKGKSGACLVLADPSLAERVDHLVCRRFE